MGRVVVSEFVSLDGVMEDPGGAEGFERGGWAFRFERGADGDRFKLDELFASDALLLGRRTYEGFAEAWPSRSDEAGFADKMNSMPKFVVSSTLRSAEWSNSSVIAFGDIPQLREQFERDILVAGSRELVTALLREALVDELRLMMFPVVLGTGKRLFDEGLGETAFAITHEQRSADVLLLTLHPKEPA